MTTYLNEKPPQEARQHRIILGGNLK